MLLFQFYLEICGHVFQFKKTSVVQRIWLLHLNMEVMFSSAPNYRNLHLSLYLHCLFWWHSFVCVSLLVFSLGPSSDSDLTSLVVDTDSLAELDDGMASGRTSPNQPQGGATNISSCSPHLSSLLDRRTPSPAPASLAPNPEVSWSGRTSLLSSGLRRASGGSSKDVKLDYLDKASELIGFAVQKENEQDYQAAFSYYRSGVDLLLQGVQGQRATLMYGSGISAWRLLGVEGRAADLGLFAIPTCRDVAEQDT